MKKTAVQKLYALGHATWYDPFKRAWNAIVGRGAEKQLQLFLKENVTSHTNILELGCGTAMNLEKIGQLGLSFHSYTGFDFSPDMLHIARSKFSDRKNIHFEQRDITDLKNVAEKFDVILCTWVLSHLKDPITFVNETQKLLKPGGRFFLIFYSKPRWFLNFWFCPLSRLFFQSRCITNKEIRQFQDVLHKYRFAANVATTIEIGDF